MVAFCFILFARQDMDRCMLLVLDAVPTLLIIPFFTYLPFIIDLVRCCFFYFSLCLFSPRPLSAHILHRFFYHFAMHFYSGAFFLLLTLVVVNFVVAFSCRFFSMRHIFKSQIGNNRLCAVLIITCIQCTA